MMTEIFSCVRHFPEESDEASRLRFSGFFRKPEKQLIQSILLILSNSRLLK